jgi:hypothetical protein
MARLQTEGSTGIRCSPSVKGKSPSRKARAKSALCKQKEPSLPSTLTFQSAFAATLLPAPGSRLSVQATAPSLGANWFGTLEGRTDIPWELHAARLICAHYDALSKVDKAVPETPEKESPFVQTAQRGKPLKAITKPPTIPRIEVESDFTAETASSLQRAVSSRSSSRPRPVEASRPTLPMPFKASQTSSSFHDRFVSNFDDPANDKGMSIGAAMDLLCRVGAIDGKVVYAADVHRILNDMVSGKSSEAACVAKIVGIKRPYIDELQFSAVLHWIAIRKGISYTQLLGQFLEHPAAHRAGLEQYFAEFGHGTAEGLMTVYEFTRFAKALGLFTVDPSRFVEGDVHFLYMHGKEGKAVDVGGFRRLLNQVADKLGMDMQAFFHLLAERNFERSRLSGRRSYG